MVSLDNRSAIAIDIMTYGKHLHLALFGIGEGNIPVRPYAVEFERDIFAEFLEGHIFAELHNDIVQAGIEDIDFLDEFTNSSDSSAGIAFQAFCRQFCGGEGYEQMFLRVVIEESFCAEHGFAAMRAFVHEERSVFDRSLEFRIDLHIDASDFFSVEFFSTIIASHTANLTKEAELLQAPLLICSD